MLSNGERRGTLALMWAGLLAKSLFVVVLVLGALVPLFAWAEQRRGSLMQERLRSQGAPRGGSRLQALMRPIGDLARLCVEADATPAGAHRVLHLLAPAFVVVPALTAFAVIPFAGVYAGNGGQVSMVVANPDWGILALFMIGTLAACGTVLAGWASNRADSLLGSLRAGLQVVSFQLGLALSLVGVLMVYGTLGLQEMALAQDGTFRIFALLPALGVELPGFLMGFPFVLPAWGIFLQPLAFALSLACVLAQFRRPPFDAEVVEGGEAAVSERRSGLFHLGELLQGVVIAGLVATLFLGGWSLPWISTDDLLAMLAFLGEGSATLICATLHLAAFLAKLGVVMALQLAIRWSLPRLGYGEVMDLCWKVILPLALLNIFVTGAGLLLLGDAA